MYNNCALGWGLISPRKVYSPEEKYNNIDEFVTIAKSIDEMVVIYVSRVVHIFVEINNKNQYYCSYYEQ